MDVASGRPLLSAAYMKFSFCSLHVDLVQQNTAADDEGKEDNQQISATAQPH